jgi:hypothetical protein
MFVVDFEIRNSNTVCNVGVFIVSRVDTLKQVLAGPWNETRLLGRSHHGVALSRSRLSVCEYAGVIALKVVIEKFFAEAIVYIFLMCVVRVLQVVTPE